MKDISLSHLLEVAIRATEAAGNHALKNKHRRTESTENFSHDIKLVLDAESQKIAEAVIAAEFPDHGILGEEDARPNSVSGYEWIIDPIDGTMNYTHGFPYWCCSIAVRRNNQVLAGCVHAPEFGEFYTAHLEEPAKLNGETIQVSGTRNLKDALIFTGLSKELERDPDRHINQFRSLALNTQKLRINGAAALDICHVAAGSSDGFFETGIYLWDFAAAGLIAERAGAVLSLAPKADGTYAVICANGNLIDGLRSIHAQFS